MFNNRRSDIDIIIEILKIAQEGVNKTKILYQGNLSHTQLQHYLMLLLDKDIISEEINKEGNANSKIYKTTEKGSNLLFDINKTLSYFR